MKPTKEEKLKKALPTVMGYLDKRKKAKQNQLPRHLRPLPLWPIYFQMLLNAGIFFTLSWLMWNRDEFVTEAAPAIGLVVCLLLLIYTLITALQLKQRYEKLPGHRWAKINVWLMIAAGLMYPASVAFFLP
jgi:hypothetical protein